MKTYPARFVGKTTYNEAHVFMRDARVGDVAIVVRTEYPDPANDHGPYLAIKCACGSLDMIALFPYRQNNGAQWVLSSTDPVHIDPSVVFQLGPESKRCHYFVHSGQLQMLDDTTATLLPVPSSA